MNQLEQIFGELGISHYLETFVDQGFDTWETILDITESDLDALGVKLGHRRKLQRRIANYRGQQVPVTTLVSPTRTSIEDTSSSNANKLIQPETKDITTSTKRKYRRHPKVDEHAPERPPSAYVLFSNKMRDDLKGQNLTFTEIAKLVGENWQNLDRNEKEPYETQAQEAKERYNREMAEYKKTPEYRAYCDYLQEFRQRQAAHDKDASKRIKTDADSGYRGSSSSISMGSNGIAGGSGSESQPGSEPPPTRKQRMSSTASQPETRVSPVLNAHPLQYSPDQLLQSPLGPPPDDASVGPRPRGISNPAGRDAPAKYPRRQSTIPESQQIPENSPASSLPPPLRSGAITCRPFPRAQRPRGDPKFVPFEQFCLDLLVPTTIIEEGPVIVGKHIVTGLVFDTSNTNEYASAPWSPPGQHPPPLQQQQQHQPHIAGRSYTNSMSPNQVEPHVAPYPISPINHLPPMMAPQAALVHPTTQPAPIASHPPAPADAGLDGMSALLRASDIVGRGNV
ncbi:high mobility group protein- variant 1 [Apiospora kogelbergensis]|uniref:High mobility group protein- variant 1 n=1 Tax=Apiospora kogelbergensis TaxID=1337665 RepID=A0AAW0QQX8_9PEZI